MKLVKLDEEQTKTVIAMRTTDFQQRGKEKSQPGTPVSIDTFIVDNRLVFNAAFEDTSQITARNWTREFFFTQGIRGVNELEVFTGASSKYKNHRNIARVIFDPTLPEEPAHGGARPGSGAKPIHTDPDQKERNKKFRATDDEWERFKDLTPTNSRAAFLAILDLLEKNTRA